MEEGNTPLKVIVPLSDANIPGFQEGSIYSNSTLSSAPTGDSNCVILDNGTLSCWGYNAYGQLGDGTTNNREIPTHTSSLTNGKPAVAISLGTSHACGILEDGSVNCWGKNDVGQLGEGSNTDSLTPVQTYSFGNGNQAIAISRLGGKVNFISKLGDDDYGKLAINNFKKDNINTSNIIISKKHKTGVAGIHIDKNTGKNAITVIRGAPASLTLKEIDTSVIKQSKIFLTQLEVPLDVTYGLPISIISTGFTVLLTTFGSH